MGLEAASFISQLDAANPLGTDLKQQGDDHLRLIKSVLLASFPNIGGAVTLTHTQINGLLTSINALPVLASGRIDNPSVTGVSNFTPNGTAGNNEMHYIRLGSIVMCTGQIRGATGVAGGFSFRVALPIASALGTVVDDLNGLFTGPDITGGKIDTDTVNDAALFTGAMGSLTIVNAYYHFAYRVI
jgi:hypothetical protein